MQTITETPPQKLSPPVPLRPSRSRSWIPLLVALLLLPFANGGHTISFAAWLAPLFLLRFTRTHRPMIGLLVVLAAQIASLAIQYRGMVPFPTVVYVIVMFIYGLCFTLPYLTDRLLSHRLPVFAGTLVFPLSWTTIEYVLALGPFGTWFSAGYSQYGNLALIQILSVTGIWGITFLIGWTAAAANAFWEEWTVSRRVPRVATACVVVIIAALLIGGGRLALFPPSGKTVRVASLSRLPTELHPDPKVVRRFFRHEPLTPEEIAIVRQRSAEIDNDLLQRSVREAQAGARIVFWGEANGPVLKEDENELIQHGGALAKANNFYLGMVLASWHIDTTPPLENKIVLIQPDGTPAWEFFKAHPVPGGEEAISIKGDGKVRVLDTPYGRLSSVICFDADFPQLLAQASRLRADIVLDPSNDWRAIDPWHTRMASFRAVEQGFNLVRHTSEGLSAAFDYQGRQLASMDHYVTTDRVMVAQVPTQATRTLYGILGDWFAWVSIATLACLIVIAIASKTPSRGNIQ